MNITSAEFVKGVVGPDRILGDGKPQVAFVGRSNVGKSSVINSLVGRKSLVKTGSKPGKTKELNFFAINDALYFVDLPGYGYAAGGGAQMAKIREMIIWYFSESGVRPATVVLILDVMAGATKFDLDMLDILREENIPYIVVVNKVDKLNQKELREKIATIKETTHVRDIIPYSTLSKIQPSVILDRLLM